MSDFLYQHHKPETMFYNEKCVRICTFWWRRGESNPCPKTVPYNFLRVQLTFLNSHIKTPVNRLFDMVAF